MSQLSLLTGVYANVELFASLIDTVIEKIGEAASATAGEDRQRLGRLLIDASDQGQASKSYEALVLDSLLRRRTGEPLLDLKHLGKRLLEGHPDASDRAKLETLAKGLERERSELVSRLRGRR